MNHVSRFLSIGWFVRRSLFPLCLLMTSGAGLHAQAKKSPPQIYCVAYAPNLSELFVKAADDRYQRIEVSTANVLELSARKAEGGKLSLYGPANAEGKHELAAEVDMGQTSHPLVILHPAAGAQPPYATKVVDADPGTFTLGSYLLVNLSPYAIRVTQGKESVEVLPSATHIYQPKSPEGEPLAITIDYKLNEEWQLLSSSHWSHRQDRRSLVCIVEDPASQRMTVKSIPLRPLAMP